MQEMGYVQMDSLVQQSTQARSNSLESSEMNVKNLQQSTNGSTSLDLQDCNNNREDVYV